MFSKLIRNYNQPKELLLLLHLISKLQNSTNSLACSFACIWFELHYGDVTLGPWHLKWTANRLFVQVSSKINVNTLTLYYCCCHFHEIFRHWLHRNWSTVRTSGTPTEVNRASFWIAEMETVSTKFLSDYNGTCQNDNSQYLLWRKFCQNENPAVPPVT